MVRFYGLPGRKCPICKNEVFFATDVDYNAHMKTHWKNTRKNNGEYMPADLNPQLARMLSIVGTMIKDGYRYTLIDNVIWRKKVEATF